MPAAWRSSQNQSRCYRKRSTWSPWAAASVLNEIFRARTGSYRTVKLFQLQLTTPRTTTFCKVNRENDVRSSLVNWDGQIETVKDKTLRVNQTMFDEYEMIRKNKRNDKKKTELVLWENETERIAKNEEALQKRTTRERSISRCKGMGSF